jgi:hypothetical protein
VKGDEGGAGYRGMVSSSEMKCLNVSFSVLLDPTPPSKDLIACPLAAFPAQRDLLQCGNCTTRSESLGHPVIIPEGKVKHITEWMAGGPVLQRKAEESYLPLVPIRVWQSMDIGYMFFKWINLWTGDWTDEWMDRWDDGWIKWVVDGWMERWEDGWIDGGNHD